MSKNIFIGVLILGVIVCLYFILHDPKPTDSHKTDYDLVQNDNKILQEQRNAGLRKIDSLEAVSRSKDSVIEVLKAEKYATQKELDKITAGATRLAKEVKVLRKGDTSEFARKCDSLAEQAQNFAYLYNQYKDYSDSLTSVMESQLTDYTAALAEQKRLYDELYRKYEQLYKLYDNLYKDYSSVKKTVKRERLKTKIAALLALIGGGAAVLK